MRYRSLLAVVAGASLLASCEGFKEAMTAHVDVVAHAASQELSVNRLGEMLGGAHLPIPVTKENAAVIADLWVNYQLMGHAAAAGDSLSDPKEIDAAVAPMTNNMILRRYMDSVSKTFSVDSAGAEAAYAAGANNLYAARHILFAFPKNATPQQRDSVRQFAERIRPQVTSANFAQMAGKYSNEPNAGARGGSLGVFRKEQMVPEFSNAVAALKPGEISQPVMSNFGYHIIQRLPYDQAKQQFTPMYMQTGMQAAESTYLAKIEGEAGIDLKSDAVSLAKTAAQDAAKYSSSDEKLATYKGGDLTASEYVAWLQGFPPQANVAREIQNAPDTAVREFVKSVARNQVLLDRAKSAGVDLTPEERASLHHDYAQMVQMVWQALGVTPSTLTDSGKAGDKDKIAAARVETFLDHVLAGEAQPVPVPAPLANMIHRKYEWSVNQAGIDRAVQRAQQVRASADSARTAGQPKSVVPMPMGPAQQQPAPQTPPAQH